MVVEEEEEVVVVVVLPKALLAPEVRAEACPPLGADVIRLSIFEPNSAFDLTSQYTFGIFAINSSRTCRGSTAGCIITCASCSTYY